MSYPIMYTGSIVRIHPCEKLAGHRARTALGGVHLRWPTPSPFFPPFPVVPVHLGRSGRSRRSVPRTYVHLAESER
jgi:hypothetical protein